MKLKFGTNDQIEQMKDNIFPQYGIEQYHFHTLKCYKYRTAFETLLKMFVWNSYYI